MQGRDDGQREFGDAESLAGHLLPAGSVFAFLAEHRQRLFPDGAFADLFISGRGRPSILADVIASVMVLQALHGLSDRQTAEAVIFDLRWEAACGFAVTETGFHPSVLTYWRRRIAASDRPHRVFEAVTEIISATGVLAGRKRRALDSTILDDAVARQDTVTQLIAQIRRVGALVPAAGQVLAGLTGHGYTTGAKPDIAWDDPGARDLLVCALVNDALMVLDRLGLLLVELDTLEPVQHHQRIVDQGADQQVTGASVVPGDVGLGAGGVVVPGQTREDLPGGRNQGPDAADLRDQLGHGVLAGDRVVQDRGVQRATLPAGQHPGGRDDLGDRLEDPVRTITGRDPPPPVRQH